MCIHVLFFAQLGVSEFHPKVDNDHLGSVLIKCFDSIPNLHNAWFVLDADKNLIRYTGCDDVFDKFFFCLSLLIGSATVYVTGCSISFRGGQF